MAGMRPLLGLDPETGADTRVVGPLTSLWYVVFMIPFFLWVKDGPPPENAHYRVGEGLRDLVRTIKGLPRHPSLLAYLGSSMFYRDALNGMYTFGGIYALGVLDWSIMEVGIFGILAAISGAIFAWVGGLADRKFGPMPVIVVCCVVLIVTACLIVGLSPEAIFGVPVAEGSALPDQLFYVAGLLIGAAGGAVQSASRNMLTKQANPQRMTEAFGLYALSGKATTFLAPWLIAITTDITNNQRLGVTPLIGLFSLGLVLLIWVKPNGEES
jgi:UMF1 family MFS transporter